MNTFSIKNDLIILNGFEELGTKCIMYLPTTGGIILQKYHNEFEPDESHILLNIDNNVINNNKALEIIKRENADSKVYNYIQPAKSYIPVMNKI